MPTHFACICLLCEFVCVSHGCSQGAFSGDCCCKMWPSGTNWTTRASWVSHRTCVWRKRRWERRLQSLRSKRRGGDEEEKDEEEVEEEEEDVCGCMWVLGSKWNEAWLGPLLYAWKHMKPFHCSYFYHSSFWFGIKYMSMQPDSSLLARVNESNLNLRVVPSLISICSSRVKLTKKSKMKSIKSRGAIVVNGYREYKRWLILLLFFFLPVARCKGCGWCRWCEWCEWL